MLLLKSLIVFYSFHHNNTEKIANVFAKVLHAEIKKPQQVKPEELQEYDLVGFGSGIYGEKHHEEILELVDKLPQVSNKKAFIFSTSALIDNATKHKTLKKKLKFKGYLIVDEFSCKGFNTNSFMKFFGGMNKGRPNAKDLKHAEEFALNLLKK